MRPRRREGGLGGGGRRRSLESEPNLGELLLHLVEAIRFVVAYHPLRHDLACRENQSGPLTAWPIFASTAHTRVHAPPAEHSMRTRADGPLTTSLNEDA